MYTIHHNTPCLPSSTGRALAGGEGRVLTGLSEEEKPVQITGTQRARDHVMRFINTDPQWPGGERVCGRWSTGSE